MEEFSMFEHALEAASASQMDDLGVVSNISRRDFEGRTTFRFRAQVPCLEYMSLLIENGLLLRTNRAGRIYVGFEKLSRMEAVVDRYLRIADISERVYIFGEPDWKPPRHPNIKLIPQTSDAPLAREWFVIADSPSLHLALVAVDEDGFDMPDLDARRFRAFKSSDPAIIKSLVTAAENLIDASLGA